MEIIVGRKGNQPFQINDKSVSSKHLKLTTLPDGMVKVEDLSSSNGTFINGIRIIQKVVPADTLVQMGHSYTFRISDALPKKDDQTSVNDDEIKEQFLALEQVWRSYQEEKIRLQKSNSLKMFLRSVPTVIIALITSILAIVPEFATFRIFVIVAGAILAVAVTLVSFKSATSLPEQMERLNEGLQSDYICPKCKNFLGAIAYKSLHNRGYCNSCKCKWR